MVSGVFVFLACVLVFFILLILYGQETISFFFGKKILPDRNIDALVETFKKRYPNFSEITVPDIRFNKNRKQCLCLIGFLWFVAVFYLAVLVDGKTTYLKSIIGNNGIYYFTFPYLLFFVPVTFLLVWRYRYVQKKILFEKFKETGNVTYKSGGNELLSILNNQEKFHAAVHDFQSNVWGDYTSYSEEDGVCFEESGISFEKVSIHANSAYKTASTNKFAGFLVRMDFDGGDFPVIVLNSKRTLWTRNIVSPRGLNPVDIDDTDFEKEFQVYSTDKIKAKRLLCPMFMDTIQRFSCFYNDVPLSVFFMDKHVWIALYAPSRIYEPSILSYPYSSEKINKILAFFEIQHQIKEAIEQSQ